MGPLLLIIIFLVLCLFTLIIACRFLLYFDFMTSCLSFNISITSLYLFFLLPFFVLFRKL